LTEDGPAPTLRPSGPAGPGDGGKRPVSLDIDTLPSDTPAVEPECDADMLTVPTLVHLGAGVGTVKAISCGANHTAVLTGAVCGVRCAVCGVRCAVCGVRCAVCGVRCAVCGLGTVRCCGVRVLWGSGVVCCSCCAALYCAVHAVRRAR
jgi:hypothetical protein